MYIKKSGNSTENRKDLMNELYNDNSKKDKSNSKKKGSISKIDDTKNNIKENTKDDTKENTKENTEDEKLEDDTEDEEEFEEFTYDSYKSDEEYLRIANLVKNVYYCIVGVVLVLLGILYIVLFKL